MGMMAAWQKEDKVLISLQRASVLVSVGQRQALST
jgi:hypothetical protein